MAQCSNTKSTQVCIFQTTKLIRVSIPITTTHPLSDRGTCSTQKSFSVRKNMNSKNISGLGSKSQRSVFVPIRTSHAENHRRLDELMMIPSTSAETEYSFVFNPALFILITFFPLELLLGHFGHMVFSILKVVRFY